MLNFPRVLAKANMGNSENVVFKVIKRGRLQGTYPQTGEITIHTFPNGKPSGAVILRCPVCGGLQHVNASIEGPDDAPTITTVLKCGCVRCQRSFRIRSGKSYLVEPEKQTKGPELSDELKQAGAFYSSEETTRGWRKK